MAKFDVRCVCRSRPLIRFILLSTFWSLLMGGFATASPPNLDMDPPSEDILGKEIPGLEVPNGDFTVELWFSGQYTGESTQPLVGTSGFAAGTAGWTISAHRSGSWHLALNNGKKSLAYQPTAARQPLFDGGEHQVAFSIIRSRDEARMYFDGVNVAIYDINGMGGLVGDQSIAVGGGFNGSLGRIRLWESAIGDAAIAASFGERSENTTRCPTAASSDREDHLKVMAWNIWHGGRENGDIVGVTQVIDVIRDSGADIICMQETYGSGPAIADALGYYFYLRSSNLSIMSRYPIGETIDIFRPFNFGGAKVELPDGREMLAYVVWLHYLPDIREQLGREGITAEQLIEEEWATRAAEMKAILEGISSSLADPVTVPLIVAGDFNGSTHLDWIDEARHQHQDLVVDWPVSRMCADSGLIDSYRQVNPDPVADPALTFSPRFGYYQRIDYVYYKGDSLKPVASEVIDYHAVRFPSDHGAVLTEFEIASTGD